MHLDKTIHVLFVFLEFKNNVVFKKKNYVLFNCIFGSSPSLGTSSEERFTCLDGRYYGELSYILNDC